jgi:long-subunit acyl-CoA synthetase (AMP-forming)
VDEISTNFGRGLRELGLEPKSNVCIFADTKAEWYVLIQYIKEARRIVFDNLCGEIPRLFYE